MIHLLFASFLAIQAHGFALLRVLPVQVPLRSTSQNLAQRIQIASSSLSSSPIKMTGADTQTDTHTTDTNNAKVSIQETSTVPLRTAATALTPPSSSFTTEPMSLYIEDTDAYGVMFNGNYIKFYERALQQEYEQVLEHRTEKGLNVDMLEGSNDNSNGNRNSNTRLMMITHVTSHKFKSSPTLGSKFIIQGERMHDDANTDVYADDVNIDANTEVDCITKQRWNMKMIKYNNNNLDDDDDDQKIVVYNSAIITLTEYNLPHARNMNYDVSSPSSSPPVPASKVTSAKNVESKTMETSFRTYKDEFVPMSAFTTTTTKNDNDNYSQMNRIMYHLPFHNILKYFERLRSNTLGGPDILNKMQKDDGILWVVTSIDDMCLGDGDSNQLLNTDNHSYHANHHYHHHEMIMGKDVTVKSESILKRGGMIIECRQELLASNSNSGITNDSDEEGKSLFVVAKGTVTLCAIDTKHGFRPTRKIPDYVRQLFD